MKRKYWNQNLQSQKMSRFFRAPPEDHGEIPAQEEIPGKRSEITEILREGYNCSPKALKALLEEQGYVVFNFWSDYIGFRCDEDVCKANFESPSGRISETIGVILSTL
jgi:hypothetical protein